MHLIIWKNACIYICVVTLALHSIIIIIIILNAYKPVNE